MNPLLQRASTTALGTVSAALADAPWRSRTVIAAFVVALVGFGFWVRSAFEGNHAEPRKPGLTASAEPAQHSGVDFTRPLPGYVRVCASYIGGFLIGWTFRRFVKITALALAAIVAVLALAKFAGCDSTALQERVKRDAAAVRQEAARDRDYLRGLLPSTTGAALGIFWGFRRRSRVLAQAPPAPTA